MIHYLYGENSFAIERELMRIVADFTETPEKIDGSELELRDVPDIFAGQTLFTQSRLIMIRGLADNKAVWNELERYVDKNSDSTTIILVDTKTDKRSKTYKLLQKVGKVTEFSVPKNAREAEQFARSEAVNMSIKIDQKLIRQLVERVGLEPWNIVHALEKLSVLDSIDSNSITTTIDASPSEQVFGLFEASLRGDGEQVHQMCETLSLTEDPFRVMGLLTTQVTQLAALVTADKQSSVAADLGLKSDYGLSKLYSFVRDMSRRALGDIVHALANADTQMKSSGEDPWFLVEQALQKIVAIK